MNCRVCRKPLLDDEEPDGICYGCTLTDEDVEADAQRARAEMEDEGWDEEFGPHRQELGE